MNAKTKLQSMGFSAGHVQLITVAVAAFAILIVAQSDISVTTLFASADDEVKMITYEEALADATAQYGDTSDSSITEEEEQQLALLDRSFEQGQVLGDDIGIGTIPNVDELYSSEQLNAIPVHRVVTTNQDTVQQYAEHMWRIESFYNTTAMFANLNSSDPDLIKSTAKQTAGIIDSMKQIPVPSDLVEYHRYNVINYQTLYAIGNAFVTGEGDLASQTKTLFSLMNKIDSIKADINKKYKIEL